MAFSINTNVNAMKSNLYSTLSSTNVAKSIEALSSGIKMADAAYNASGLSIASGMSAQISGMGQGIQNSNNAIGMLQVADGAMGGIDDNLKRVRDLAIRASNDTLSDSDRDNIQKEINGLLKSSDDIANNTKYNGINLLDASGGSDGDGTFITQTGPNRGDSKSVSIGDARTSSLIGTVDVTTQNGRDAALNDIDTALEDLSEMRSDVGSAQNQLISSVRNMYISQINTSEAESKIKDIDFAKESANFSQQNLMYQIGSFTQAQANSSISNISSLLG